MATEIAIALAIALALIAGAVVTQFRRPQNAPVRLSEETLNQKVDRYRESIRRGTLCERCLTANPPGSRFCADCGQSL